MHAEHEHVLVKAKYYIVIKYFFACVYNNHKKNFYPCRVSNFYHINQWNRESFSQRIGPQDIGKGGVNDSYYFEKDRGASSIMTQIFEY